MKTLFSTGLSIGMGLGVMLLAGSCTGTQTASEQSYLRSDYYTRGIGQYPGCPAEDFSPELLPDGSAYRNLALLRPAYQSSAYDYNLTSQLVTDGLLTDRRPAYLVLSTPQGELPSREREWMIDGGPFSRNKVAGEDTYFQFRLANYPQQVSQVAVTGVLVYDDKAARGGYVMEWEASADGQQWTSLCRRAGNGLPGKALPGRAQVNDPNKQTEQVSMPMRQLNDVFDFPAAETYTYYRLRLKMAGPAAR